MNKTILLLTAVAFGLTGCKAMQVINTADRALNTTDRVVGMTNKTKRIVNGGGPESQRTYTVGKENFYITQAVRTSRDYGKIIHTTERNPKGMTMVILHSKHMDSGAKLVGDAYLYEVTPENWLVKKAVSVHNNGQSYLNSGRYYLKGQSNSGDFITTGEVVIQKGVSNIITIVLE